MNIVILTILILAITGALFFVLSRIEAAPTTQCKVVRAGNVETLTKVSPLTATINNLDNKKFVIDGKNIDIRDYDVFVVDGESMAQRDIHTGNGLLTTPLYGAQSLSLSEKDLIVLEIDIELAKKLHNCELEIGTIPLYKLREFICYIPSREALVQQLDKLNVKHDSAVYTDTLNKYEIVTKHYNFSEPLLLSDTYEGGTRSFSLHSPKTVTGKVAFVIPRNIIKL